MNKLFYDYRRYRHFFGRLIYTAPCYLHGCKRMEKVNKEIIIRMAMKSDVVFAGDIIAEAE